MNAVKMNKLAKDFIAFFFFAAVLAMLASALLNATGTPLIIALAFAYAVPATAGAAVRLYRDVVADGQAKNDNNQFSV
ncbi:MAG: hypothetical protein P1U67_05050 [Alcanivoracaceae bacterium]|nr:hypothetical protein [Alcanivoracaceae bacterium]